MGWYWSGQAYMSVLSQPLPGTLFPTELMLNQYSHISRPSNCQKSNDNTMKTTTKEAINPIQSQNKVSVTEKEKVTGTRRLAEERRKEIKRSQ